MIAFDLNGTNGLHAIYSLVPPCFWQLKALGTEGMMKELIQYLRVAEDQFSHGNTYIGIPIYNTVLHGLVEAKEVSRF